MRRFADREGCRWEAAVTFGSYGEMRVIFSQMHGHELRSAAMTADTLIEAERELDALGDESLVACLDGAEPWE